MDHITGGCLCGDVTYVATSKPLLTRACWCQLCQTLACGNATINAVFKTSSLTVTGELRDYQSTADDGNTMHRKFCVRCGTHLFSEADERPDVIVVRIGTLHDSSTMQIDGIIWTSEAPAWAALDPSIPQFSHQPPEFKIPKKDH